MVRVCVFETRCGWMGLAGKNGRLSRCVLPQSSHDEARRQIAAGLGEAPVEDEAAFGDLPDKLRSYFEGEKVDFGDTALDLDGHPEFVRKALTACREAPYGTVVTYRELAKRAGSEKASRAVGNAMARNPMPVIIPCHRVVALNGGMGGFSAGIDWKRRLLKLEGVDL